jgi:hypothetical protein
MFGKSKFAPQVTGLYVGWERGTMSQLGAQSKSIGLIKGALGDRVAKEEELLVRELQ